MARHPQPSSNSSSEPVTVSLCPVLHHGQPADDNFFEKPTLDLRLDGEEVITACQ